VVEAGQEKLIIDCGRGASQRLWQLGITVSGVTATFHTHHHSDHVEGNPRFANASGGDFHLRAGSPAGNVGSAAGTPPRDFDDVPRPQGAGHDIGAFER
jgi:glyoxylase-like metal-dependent hydrolase (beta-lactamase superfamily II)